MIEPPALRVRRERAAAWLGGARVSRANALETAGTVGLSVATILFNAVTVLALTRLLGPQAFGAFAYGLAVGIFLSIPAALGLSPLVVRTVAGATVDREWGRFRGVVRRSYQSVLVASTLILALAIPVGFILRENRPALASAYFVGLVMIPIVTVATVRQSTIQGFGHVVASRVPETVVQPV